MAQVFVFGRVTDPLEQNTCPTGSVQLHFHLMEKIEKGQSQIYLVYARGDNAARLVRRSIVPGTYLWITGALRLVTPPGHASASILKIYLTNFGILPHQGQFVDIKGTSHGMNAQPPRDPFPVILDGEREPLPE